MGAFDFVFSLIGLLLGLSLIEVLSGLMRTLKVRNKVRIGLLTPLLGIWVIADVTSFCGVWRGRCAPVSSASPRSGRSWA